MMIYSREATTDDAAFIVNSWLRSYAEESDGRARNPLVMAIRKSDYYEGQRERCLWLLDQHGATVIHAPQDKRTILAWACADWGARVLHYVYVKHDQRRLMYARALIGHSQNSSEGPLSQATHHTTGGFPILRKILPDLRYNPYLLEM